MLISVLKSKIHRVTVTDADLDYMGSISIDAELMVASGLVEYEKVHVLNITNGVRLETYVIKAKKGSRYIGINGAAAHHVSAGDLVIIVAYCRIKEKDVNFHKPKIVHVDENNCIINTTTTIDSII